MIYLASPYSDPDPNVQERRFVEVCRAAGRLMAAGHLIFSPIAHTHPIACQGNLPKDYKFWRRYDEEMLQCASEIWILTLPGWRTSSGVAAEAHYAMTHDQPLRLVAPDTLVIWPSPPPLTEAVRS